MIADSNSFDVRRVIGVVFSGSVNGHPVEKYYRLPHPVPFDRFKRSSEQKLIDGFIHRDYPDATMVKSRLVIG